MSAMMNLAKQRAAMVVGDFDFRNNGAPLTALPAALLALNATYTRNSVKNVVQSGALVALTANQFGTSYDDVAAQYGYVSEPAATNLCTNSDGNAATYTVSNTADGTAVPGFTNGIAFGNNSVQRSAFKTVSMTSGTTYSVSVFVQMDDGGAPVVGTANNAGDFCLLSEVLTHTSAALVSYIGNGVYRVSSSRACVSSAAWYCGVKKYTGQSARTFRITGIQVETGLRATSYIATTGSTASRSADVLTVPLWVNNVKDSQDGSTANWTRTSCTVTTSGTAPDGSATAQLLTASSTAPTTAYNNSCKAPSTNVTASIYVKAGNKPTAIVGLRNNTTYTTFQTGTLTFATGEITGAGWTATNVGSGWFRCTFTQSSGISVGDTLYIYPFITQALTSGDTQYFWGAQIEPGSVATAYRPTTSTLESAANANITGFSSAAYTMAVDQRMDATLAASVIAAEISDLTTSNRALIYASAGTTSIAALTTNSVSQGAANGSALGLTRKRYAGSFSANSITLATAGAAATPDTSATMPTGLLFIHIGAAFNSVIQYNGFIYRAQLIPTALTQAQLNGLTT